MKKILLCLAAGFICLAAFGQYIPSEGNLAAREEFKEHRLGIFLHWGIYSSYAQGEWYLQNAKLDSCAYMAAAKGFYPAEFDADAWAQAFASAGAGYVTMTSRHHDGFSMYATKASGFNIVDGTPFGRDVLAELTQAVKARGMKMHFYYSLIDWIRPDYPLGEEYGIPKDPSKADYNHYFEFEKVQIRELLSYEPAALWFDGIWDHTKDFDWRMPELYQYIHSLAPDCLIGNNHHQDVIEGEDFQMFEKNIPGGKVSSLPLEACETMNSAWGYRVDDQNYKSLKELVSLLVRKVSKDTNLLLNIGPMASGELPAPAIERLRELGDWMRANGHSVNGCGATGLPDFPWGVTTRNANHLYLHILEPSAVPADKIIKVELDGKTYYRKVPAQLDPVDTIIDIIIEN